MTGPDSVASGEDTNPFEQRLPPKLGKAEQFEMLQSLPRWSEEERSLSHVDRRYLVLRLLDYMDPLNGQLDLVERFDMAIRQGYRGRNPSNLLYRQSVLESADAIAAGRDPLSSTGEMRVVAEKGYTAVYAGGEPLAPRMPGFLLIGVPGMGKSATMDRILHEYPLIIRHTDTPETIIQVPALKIECPPTGSRKSFCLEFFRQIDERLGLHGNLYGSYVRRNQTTDTMLADVQHMVRLHAIGVLVVDEIQFLNKSKEGIQPLINFLVSMANKIGVGIVMIGTMSARNIPQAAFHSARRAVGLGCFVWDRLHHGDEWATFVESMWKYQWTSTPTPLSPELDAKLYEHTQGVIDIVLKLFILAQLRVITNAELSGTPETLTPEVLEAIAKEDLALVAPMIDALRTGDFDKLDEYPDLQPFHEYFGTAVNQVTGRSVAEIRERLRAEDAAKQARSKNSGDERRQFYLEMLKGFGHSASSAEKTLDAILEEVDPEDVGAMAREIGKRAPTAGQSAPSPRLRKRPVELRVQVEGDLRDIRANRPKDQSMHSLLRECGIVRSPRETVAA